MPLSILISGAGIAGQTLAFWLRRYGFRPTLVECAPEPRRAGYVIDFWGSGFDVAERMGLVPAIRAAGYNIEEVRLVNNAGLRVAGFSGDVFRHPLGDRFVSIERGELARLLFDCIDGNVEMIFADTVKSIEERLSGVAVEFVRSQSRVFDLVIGADGLHSKVRSLSFGEGFEHRLGFQVAAARVARYGHRREGAYVSYCAPGRQAARYSLRNGLTGLLFVFRSGGRPAVLQLNDRDRHALLREVFSGAGWECAEMVDAAEKTADLYVDDVSQVRLPNWHRGRVALVGDAAYCPSLLAGEGASMAMAGAYILAGELMRCFGRHDQAFQRYESLLRPLVERKQRSAVYMGGWFAPRTQFGIWLRNSITAALNLSLISRFVIRPMLSDQLELPLYGDEPDP